MFDPADVDSDVELSFPDRLKDVTLPGKYRSSSAICNDNVRYLP